MEPLISILSDKCTNCFTCIRVCPVKAIRADVETMYPKLDINRCIGCGTCIESCAPQAIIYRSSLDEATLILKSAAKKAVIVSASIAAEFNDITDYRKFVQMVRLLGVDYVYESSFSTDLIAYKYLKLFSDFKGRYYVTSCDPVVVNYIEKYHPNLINNLIPLVSPMIAMAKVVRNIHGEKIKLIYAGPDIASKDEILLYNDDGKINSFITFPELRRLFRDFDINESHVDFSEFDTPIGYKGSLYPLVNGLIQAADIDENLLTTHVICVEGKQAMMESIEEFEDNVKVIHRNIHITYGNSLEGPGISKKGNKLFKEHLTIKFVNKRLSNFFRAEWYNNMEKYGKLDFSCMFSANDQRLPEPSGKKIDEALLAIGRKPDDVFNCNQCGYSSCREFAVDMAKGIVIPQMCSVFAVQNSQQHSENLKEVNENLARTRQALRESEEKARLEHDLALKASELSDAMLEKLRAGIVIVDFRMRIVRANSAFCRILGEEAEEINKVVPGLVDADLKKLLPAAIYNLFSYVITNSEMIESRDIMYEGAMLNLSVFPIRENQIAGGIIRDMQAPEVQRSEVIKRVSEVIDKNLEMVQKIGFLIGENASDIERMLNSIIQFYEKDTRK